jgi:hypothetical protein
VVECLPSKVEALSSNPSTPKKKEEEEMEKGRKGGGEGGEGEEKEMSRRTMENKGKVFMSLGVCLLCG